MADIIYVKRYAPGANNGTSWKDAYTDLQLALTASVSGDEIWVAAGIHRPSVMAGGTDERHKTFQLKNGVALYGGFAGDETTRSQRNWTANPTHLCGDLGYTGYDADNSFHVFYHPFGLYLNQSAILDGFVIRNGRAYSTGSGHEGYGGGMYNDECSPTIRNCTFLDNFASNGGGGIYNVNEVNAIISDCVFRNNSAKFGGAVANTDYCDVRLTRCEFDRNSAETDGGGLYSDTYSNTKVWECVFRNNRVIDDYGAGGGLYNGHSSHSEIVNCLFYYNRSYYGGGIKNYSLSDPLIVNCTFAYNEGYHSGGAIHNTKSSPTLINCIIGPNVPEEIVDVSNSVTTITYSNVRGTWPGIGNIETPPLYRNVPKFLDRTVAAGTTTTIVVANPTLYAVSQYIEIEDDGVKRTITSIKNFTLTFTPALSNASTAGLWIGNWGSGFAANVLESFRVEEASLCIDAGNNGAQAIRSLDLDGRPRFLGDVSKFRVDMGAYEYGRGYIFVDEEAMGGNHGRAWLDAYTDLQDALEEAASGDQIWVAAGTYRPSVRMDPALPRSAAFQLKNGVTLYGGFDPTTGDVNWPERDWIANRCVLSGDIGVAVNLEDNCYHVFYHPAELALDDTAILDGFVISDGYGYMVEPLRRGAGIHNHTCSPTLKNLCFENNRAFYGAAIYNENASPLISYCTFGGSLSTANHPIHGTLCNMDASPTVSNCTFKDNYCSGPGGRGVGMYNENSNPIVSDCLFDGNTGMISTEIGGALCSINSSGTFTDCTFFGNRAQSKGGAIYCDATSTPIFTRCVIEGNHSNLGGGVYCEGGSPVFNDGTVVRNNHAAGDYGGGIYCAPGSIMTLEDCLIDRNSSSQSGGGMYNDAAAVTLTRCVFDDNNALTGGGLVFYFSSEVIVENSTFIANRATGSPGIGFNGMGGAVFCYDSSPEFVSSVFRDNVAKAGGAIAGTFNCAPRIIASLFDGNIGEYDGGAVLLYDQCSLTLINSILCNNRADGGPGHYGYGGAIYSSHLSTATLLNCTLWNNTAHRAGGGIRNEGTSAMLSNCILWDNSPDQISQYTLATVNYSNCQGGFPGIGNIDITPDFSCPLEGDFRLLQGSACIDSGSNDAVPVDITTDAQGHPRISDGDCDLTAIVDMGAYEFNYAFMGSLDGDCRVDFHDFAILATAWMTADGDLFWNTVCDISDPPDGRIDFNDLTVLIEYWLYNIPID